MFLRRDRSPIFQEWLWSKAKGVPRQRIGRMALKDARNFHTQNVMNAPPIINSVMVGA